jgi:hypothetical protein
MLQRNDYMYLLEEGIWYQPPGRLPPRCRLDVPTDAAGIVEHEQRLLDAQC